MKRYSLLVVCTLMLVLICASASLAVFPKPDGQIKLQLQQGFVDDEIAWFICTDTSDINTAFAQNLNLAPPLKSLIGNAANKLFIVCNAPCTQGPVFCAAPGDNDYSGKWQEFIIKFKPGFERQVTNCDKADDDNPTGLPPKSEATITETNIVIDCPIVAIGQLGGPWRAMGGNVTYRIPEGITHDPLRKTITLPTFNVFCSNPLTQQVMVDRVIIVDVGDKTLAFQLGANFAPRLKRADEENVEQFFVFTANKPCLVPPFQFPIMEECPFPLGPRNSNFEYTPTVRVFTIDRSKVNPCTLFTQADVVEDLIDDGVLLQKKGFVTINASVVGTCR